MRKLALVSLVGLSLLGSTPATATDSADDRSTRGDADRGAIGQVSNPRTGFSELLSGNQRFVAGKRTRSVDTRMDRQLRAQMADRQRPFAVIVTCSDSRVPESILFDQEPGRLFTVREAGNSPDSQGIASIEYAIENLGSKVIVLMGHNSCGAVKAVQAANGKPLPGNYASFQSTMSGLLESTPRRNPEHEKAYTSRLIESNARRQAEALAARSAIVGAAMKSGNVWLFPAVYDLRSGEVKFLPKIEVPSTTVATSRP